MYFSMLLQRHWNYSVCGPLSLWTLRSVNHDAGLNIAITVSHWWLAMASSIGPTLVYILLGLCPLPVYLMFSGCDLCLLVLWILSVDLTAVMDLGHGVQDRLSKKKKNTLHLRLISSSKHYIKEWGQYNNCLMSYAKDHFYFLHSWFIHADVREVMSLIPCLTLTMTVTTFELCNLE